MDDLREKIDATVQELKKERDELRVRVRLAKMEASEEWEELQEKLGKLDSKAQQLRKATAEASEDIGAAARLLGSEIRDGFKKLARSL